MSSEEYEKAQRELAYLWLCDVITFQEWEIRKDILTLDYWKDYWEKNNDN